jgi:hypothetical protein
VEVHQNTFTIALGVVEGNFTGNPAPGGITGPLSHYSDLVLQVGSWTQGCKPRSVNKLLLQKPKKWKPEGYLAGSSKERYGSKSAVLSMMMMHNMFRNKSDVQNIKKCHIKIHHNGFGCHYSPDPSKCGPPGIEPNFFFMCVKGKKVKLSLCIIKQALCHEDIWGSGGITPLFLTLALDGGEWPWPLYPQGNRPWFPLDRRLSWAQETIWTL